MVRVGEACLYQVGNQAVRKSPGSMISVLTSFNENLCNTVHGALGSAMAEQCGVSGLSGLRELAQQEDVLGSPLPLPWGLVYFLCKFLFL